jgi:hypothetical protein
MAHFAKIDSSGVVINVITAEPDFFDTYIDSSPGEWIQTSYNTRGGIHYDPVTGNPSEDQSKALRKNYAYIGGTYDKVRDAFISKKPAKFPSWILDEETCTWVAPVAKPTTPLTADKRYVWNEQEQQWDTITYSESPLTSE